LQKLPPSELGQQTPHRAAELRAVTTGTAPPLPGVGLHGGCQSFPLTVSTFAPTIGRVGRLSRPKLRQVSRYRLSLIASCMAATLSPPRFDFEAIQGMKQTDRKRADEKRVFLSRQSFEP